MKKFFLVFASAGLLALAGCAIKPPAPAAEPTVVGQIPADPPKNPVISTETLKADAKSIAVTDIYTSRKRVKI